jgi:hypothetical protein
MKYFAHYGESITTFAWYDNEKAAYALVFVSAWEWIPPSLSRQGHPGPAEFVLHSSAKHSKDR